MFERKCKKNNGKSWQTEDKNIFWPFFKFLLNFKADALQSELNKVSISNFGKFQLQCMSYKIE